MVGVVLVAMLLLVAGGALLVVRAVGDPEVTDEDRARTEARYRDTEAMLRASRERPPARAPAIDEDAREIVERALARLPRTPGDAELDWGELERLWPLAVTSRLAPGSRAAIDARFSPVAVEARRAAHATRASWSGPSSGVAMAVASGILLDGVLEAHDASSATECLERGVDALAIAVDSRALLSLESHGRWAFERCARMAPIEARRDAAARIHVIVAHEPAFGPEVERATNEWLEYVWSRTLESFDYRSPLRSLRFRSERRADLADARATLDRGVAHLRALTGDCLPDCVDALRSDPATTELEQDALTASQLTDAVQGAVLPRLIGVMLDASSADEAAALERWRDPMTGRAFGAMTVDGRRVYYSLGWNRADDHGSGDDLAIRGAFVE